MNKPNQATKLPINQCTSLRSRPGGMRRAMTSAAPAGEQSVMKLDVRFAKFLQSAKQSRSPRIPPTRPVLSSICQHLQAHASIHFERSGPKPCGINARNQLFRIFPASLAQASLQKTCDVDARKQLVQVLPSILTQASSHKTCGVHARKICFRTLPANLVQDGSQDLQDGTQDLQDDVPNLPR